MRDEDIGQFRQNLRGRLITRSDSDYDEARSLYNAMIDKRPLLIAKCVDTADIIAAVNFGREHHLLIAIRGGGHNGPGLASCDDGLVIDLSMMKGVRVDPARAIVRVEPGCTSGDVDHATHVFGLAVPFGIVASTGVAGLTLGGGVGILGRLYGLTSDNLTSLQIVTANGSVLTCDGARNSDLFWACRGGGGGNFGVVTSFTFRSHQLRQLILFGASWPWSQAARVVSAWQSWAPFAPDALWSNLVLSCPAGGSPTIQVGGSYVGSVSGAARLLNELYARVGSGPTRHNLLVESFLNAMLLDAGCYNLSVAQCHTRPGGRLPRVPSYAKSDFFTTKLDAAGIRTLLSGVERMRGVRGTPGGVGAIAFDAFGGAINRVGANATAFVHRNALYDAQYSTSWTYPGSARGVANQHAWLRSYYASLHPHASGQAYQNYIDPDLTNWRQAYYGANYSRLSQVKAKYDPKMLFNFPQAITPPG